MIYLLLGILCSASIAITMRLAEGRVRNNMLMLASNYAACLVLAWVMLQSSGGLDLRGEGLPFALGLGAVNGVLYIAGLVLYQRSIRSNGVVLSATFMKLGVLVPTVMAIVVFGEKPGAIQTAGLLGAITAILLMNYVPDGQGESRLSVMLLVLLAVSGTSDSLSNVFNVLGEAGCKDLFLLMIFVVALLLAIVMILRNGERFCVKDAMWGIAVGVPNYFSARFVLLALAELPAIIVYPVYNILTIMIVTLVGVAAFREKLTRTKWIALGMITLAIAALSL